jgi:hypothetical protein
MDARWIALVLFALLAGLGGSFIFSYVIYQPQIASLRAELDELQGQIAELRSASSGFSTLLELRSELDELKSTLLNLNSILVGLNCTLQRLLSGEPYARFERLEIISIYAETAVTGWEIVISVMNTGLVDAIIDNILLNGRIYTQYTTHNIIVKSLPTVIRIGEVKTIEITITPDNKEPFVPGVSVEVRLHSASHQEYPKTITLP